MTQLVTILTVCFVLPGTVDSGNKGGLSLTWKAVTICSFGEPEW